ncbi:MAG: response regulator, partial [Microlunatus sp.]|nr:response regulator [Microlunatus sp.]
QQPTSDLTPEPRDTEPTLTGRKVLLVDDDARNVLAIAGILELNGMVVRHAPNGRRGIDELLADPEVDLILMDVMMPEMDGYATTAAIREMPRFDQLPIIMVTAKAMAGDREKSLASGASDYVTKPVDPDELLSCIGRWLAA